MKWNEFRALLVGLGSDTPLGRMASIRAEDDKDVLKHFTKDQHRIRNVWRARLSRKVTEKGLEDILEQFKQAFISMAGGG